MIEIIDLLKPKNGGSFKLIEDIDIAVNGYSSLADCVAHMATTAMIEAINAALSGKQDKLTTEQLAAVNSGITAQLVAQIGTNTTAIAGKASQSDLTALQATVNGKADAADLAALESEVDTKADSSDLTTATASLQAQIDNIVSGSTADSEVINARVGLDGTSYATLKARIDSAERNTASVDKSVSTLVSGLKSDGIPTDFYIAENDFGTPYKTNAYYYSNTGSQVGVALSNMHWTTVSGANTYLISLPAGLTSIKFRVFQTSSEGGSYFLDENQICVAEMINTTAATGSIQEYTVPANARYLLYSVSKGLYDTGLDIFVQEKSVDTIASRFSTITERLDATGVAEFDIIPSSDFGSAYKSGKLLDFTEIQLGKYIDDIDATDSMSQARIFKIDISNALTVEFPVFKSSSNMGSCFLNDDEVCIGELVNDTEDTGTYVTYNAPVGTKYLLYSVSKSLYDSLVPIRVKYSHGSINGEVNKALELASKEKIDKIILTSGYIYTNVDVGDTVNLTVVSSNITKSAVVNCAGYNQVTITGHGGENGRLWAFIDEDDKLVSKSDETLIVSNLVLPIPNGANRIVINSTTDDACYMGIPKINLYNLITEKAESDDADITKKENRNLCLGGIKTDIVSNKTPYHSGFLFHKLRNDDKSLWYGNRFDKLKKIGTVDFYPSQCRLAVSPKDGRVIATVRDTRQGIYVWDGETTTLVNGFTVEPMAWLYNSGVDFIIDNQDDEYCIFAEYKSSGDNDGFNVWRGKYPYTSAADWEVVLHQNYGWTGEGNITHFHQIKRDPWTDILYCTSGDSEQSSAVCRWWYSTDYGATWTLLTDGVTSGYEEHITRIINFIFTKDYIYFATDHGTNHCLNRVSRDNNGIIDVSSRVKLCDLPEGHATNSLCYSHAPKGLFMYDRIDTGYTEHYGEDIPLQFYDLRTNTLKTITTLNLVTNDWGGCRGKCYINYTNGNQPYPAMGYGTEALCVFDLANSGSLYNIATVEFDFDGTVHTVEH